MGFIPVAAMRAAKLNLPDRLRDPLKELQRAKDQADNDDLKRRLHHLAVLRDGLRKSKPQKKSSETKVPDFSEYPDDEDYADKPCFQKRGCPSCTVLLPWLLLSAVLMFFFSVI